MKVFISWSWDRSKAVATALREWLEYVVPVKPWMSEEDIEAGARWSDAIAGSLKEAACGIVCVTPENRDRPWMLFEAGALAKAFETARVTPYLFGFDDKSLPGSPLSQLQAKLANESDTLAMVKSINASLGEKGHAERHLERVFKKWWPELRGALAKIPPDANAPPPRPSVDERLSELLDLARSQKAEIEVLREEIRRSRPSLLATLAAERGRPPALVRGGGGIVNRGGEPGALAPLMYGAGWPRRRDTEDETSPPDLDAADDDDDDGQSS